MNTVHFGIIGAGQVAGNSINDIKSHPRARVVAACDLHPQRLQDLCREHEIEKDYSSAAELFADPGVDAVYIAVPNKFHAPLSIEALQAGKHVILDKPFAMNAAEAEEVAAVARASGRVFTLGMNIRFEAAAQKIRALVEADSFGEIYHAKAYWFRREGIPKLGTWFGKRELSGGGCLNDIGVHLLDVCLYLAGRFDPVSVVGVTYTKFGNRGLGEGGWGKSDKKTGAVFDVDDFASALIRFSNGFSVTLEVSWACHAEEGSRMNVELFGTEGGATVWPPKVFRRDPDKEEYQVEEVADIPTAYPHNSRFHNFINHLTRSEPLCVSIEQALAVQRILDAIAESSAKGETVWIGTSGTERM